MAETKGKGLRRLRTVARAAAALAGGAEGLGEFGAEELYNAFFRRWERPAPGTRPGMCEYAPVMGILPRETLTFPSDGVRLAGYYYPVAGSRRLVVLAHGMHAGADDYLPIVWFFTQNGYAVFAFDYKGTYDSGGDSCVGMCESLVDLDHALDFLSREPRFSGMKKYLCGHSWGGFAVAAVLALHPEVAAAVSISGFDNAYTLITEKGYQYAGELATQGISRPFLERYQKKLFGDYVRYTAADGINASGVPVLLAHGEDDKIISFGAQSVLSRREEIRNPRVTAWIGRGVCGGHDTVWHSERAAAYQMEVEEALRDEKKRRGGKLTEEELRQFLRGVDPWRYSELNDGLFSGALALFGQN